jgi:hypothetical protein
MDSRCGMTTLDDNARAQGGDPVSDPEEGAATASIPGLVCLADVEPLEVQWLWQDRLPAGMVAVLDGPPGVGKSTLIADIAARISTGRPLPGESEPRVPSNVLLIGCEDSAAHTVRPRLDAAGADAHRVHLLEDIDGKMISLPTDVSRIEAIVRETGATLVAIDPLTAYIGQVDFHRDNEVRGALTPLAGLAQRTGAAVLVVRHLRKAAGTDALGRGLGSIAIAGVARTVMLLLGDPDDQGTMVLAWSKLNVAPTPPSLRWSRSSVDGRPQLVWGGECALSADELLARHDQRHSQSGKGGQGNAVDAAARWLMDVLEGPGVLPVDELRGRADADGIGWRTVERAKARLAVRARRVGTPGAGSGGHWVWAAPSLEDRKAGEVGADSEPSAKAANGEPLAVLHSNSQEPISKGAKSRRNGTPGNAATAKTAKPTLAALTSTGGEPADDARPQGGVSSERESQ